MMMRDDLHGLLQPPDIDLMALIDLNPPSVGAYEREAT